MQGIYKSVFFGILLNILLLPLTSYTNPISNNAKVNDAYIVSQINCKVKDNSLLQKITVYATSNQGYVTLNGVVDTQSQINEIIALANTIPGVKKVDVTNLKVKKVQLLTDAQIISQINKKIKKDDLLKDIVIYAKASNGNIALVGKVDTDAQAERLVSLARSIQGVKKVDITDLQIKRDE